MSASQTAATEAAETPDDKETPASFAWFVTKLVIAVFVFRSFFFSFYTIPSESMLPRLWNGDYFIAAKWPYGFSRWSLPFNLPLIPGQVLSRVPERGDVVVFKHPIDKIDYIKRAVALPGDSVAMRDGQVILNGVPVKRERIADFVIPVSPNTRCHPMSVPSPSSCAYARFRETLPSGLSYDTLDFGRTPQDDFGPIVVPQDTVFVLGDNRDNSQDSRFPAQAGGGVGLVPQELMVARPAVMVWSTDGSASWIMPWTWLSALRGDRMGDGI
ncbi:signal peptidase I [Tsuneonella sp. HG249]